MQVRKNLGRLLWGHYEVDKSIFERLQTECSMLLGVLLGAWAGRRRRESPRLQCAEVL